MSNYFSEMFKRANIKQIRSFLMYGNGEIKSYDAIRRDRQPYIERITRDMEKMENIIEVKYPNKDERDEIMERITKYVDESNKVHLEAGLQCGFSIAIQMLENTPGGISGSKLEITDYDEE